MNAITLVAWFVIGATIFLTTFYLNIYWKQKEEEQQPELKSEPSITILMPAYNEEDVVEESLENALDLEYPNYEVMLIDDGSTDATLEIARGFEHDGKLTVIEHDENQGKAAALNTGLEKTDADYVVVQDADSRIEPELLKKAAARMEHDRGIHGVISSINSFEHDTFIQRLQRIQYRLTNFYRSLMSEINTLDVTPGAFSMYRADRVKELGGFDLGNPTEDLEMAWKIREAGGSIDMVFGNYSSTHYPPTLRDMYHQRIRWKRGSIVNSFKYRHMFFNSDYGWFGRLQLPIHIMSPLLAAISLLMVVSGLGERIYNFMLSVSAVGFTMPVIKLEPVRMLLGMQMKIYAPLAAGLLLSAYVIKKAYGKAGESVHHPVALSVYYLMYFAFEASFALAAILKELFRTKRVWN